MIEKDMLLRIGKNKGLTNKEHIEKSYFQDVLLFNIFKRTNKFVFKGGTALYKLYKLPRFSEDLDFSLLDIGTAEAEKAVSEIVEKLNGFEIKSVKKTNNSIMIKIGIKGILTRYNTIRVDINVKNKVIRDFDVKTFVPDFIDINPFTMRILKLEEIVAEKIHSVFMRRKARDLFDLFFLLRMSSFDINLVQEKLAIFGMDFKENIFVKKVKALESLWTRELKPFVLGDLFPFKTAKEFVFEKMGIK